MLPTGPVRYPRAVTWRGASVGGDEDGDDTQKLQRGSLSGGRYDVELTLGEAYTEGQQELTTLSARLDLNAARVLANFNTLIPSECLALRGGAPTRVPTAELVVGDVVLVQTGCSVPADLRVTRAAGLKVDKSMLTGEAEPVRATAERAHDGTSLLQASNTLLMGTNVVEGEGVGIVIASGADNQLSKIAVLASTESGATTLQIEIERFVRIIAGLAVVTGAGVVVWWSAYLNVRHPGFMSLVTMLSNTIGVVVAYIPDGLPLAHRVLLKRLGTIETLGSVSLIATDKTGTLTCNQMTVCSIITAGAAETSSNSSGNDATNAATVTPAGISKRVAEGGTAAAAFAPLLRVATLCNQSQLLRQDSPAPARQVPPRRTVFLDDDDAAEQQPQHEQQLQGGHAQSPGSDGSGAMAAAGSNGVDVALLNWAHSLGAAQPLLGAYRHEALLPFSSTAKTACAVVRLCSDGAPAPAPASPPLAVLVKGAPERILEACTSYYPAAATDAASQPAPMTGAVRAAVAAAVDAAARRGQRVVTGDAPATAVAIARDVGIITGPENPDTASRFIRATEPAAPSAIAVPAATAAPSVTAVVGCNSGAKAGSPSNLNLQSQFHGGASTAMVLVGDEANALSAEGWDFVLSHRELVFARAMPEQKLLLVKEAAKRGDRVGVTGDGVNDSPALRNADVGIAMSSGSSIASDAADMVLLTDDFAAIVQGVCEGRLIFDNLRKEWTSECTIKCATSGHKPFELQLENNEHT
ncbi:E1-E2 ATPase-domain-containing protein [Tribonema minus]|uniref:E1-E2 ATPase-domain-containing protein n=1 Tax=Tribonema minus TaxID=303371 RepID=A0A835YP65_9STRA|nr:E1-E2 ATPase-domain-containing protein [Tribonema minus]